MDMSNLQVEAKLSCANQETFYDREAKWTAATDGEWEKKWKDPWRTRKFIKKSLASECAMRVNWEWLQVAGINFAQFRVDRNHQVMVKKQ